VTLTGVVVEPQFPRASTAWYPVELPRGRKVFPVATDPVAADVDTWNWWAGSRTSWNSRRR